MNKVFKVIWNHATQTWTAVSELGHAKGKTKSKKIVKLTALAGAVLGVVGTAQAAVDVDSSSITIASNNPTANEATKGKQNINIGTGANTYRNANGKVSHDAIAIGSNATGTGDAAVAIGLEASATEQNGVAIGHKAKNTSQSSVAIGENATSSKDMDVAIGKNAAASGGESLSFGSDSKASGQATVAVGKESNASGSSAISAGYQSAAAGDNAVAVGKNTTAGATNAIAVGLRATATGTRAIATGAGSSATGEQSLANGFTAKASGENSIAQGNAANASAANATAIGTLSNASGVASFAGGTSAKAIGDNSIAIGGATDMDDDEVLGKKQTGANAAKANGKKSIAIGFNATTSEYAADSVVMGTFANAKAASTVVIGEGALADEDARYSVVVGNTAKARDGSAVAIGRRANANAYDAIALGDNATSSGISIGAESMSSTADSITLGHAAVSEGSETVTIGNSAWSKQDVSYAVTLGANAINSANYSTALGHAANTAAYYSVALGAASEAGNDFAESSSATVNNVTYGGFAASTSSFNEDGGLGAVVSVGKKGYERQIKHVAAGQVTNTSTDAINGSQLYSVADALATKINKQHWNVGDNNGAVVNGVYHEDQVNFVNGTVTTVKVVDASSGSAPGQKSGPNITNVSYDVNVGTGLKIEDGKIVTNIVAGNGVTFDTDRTSGKITINAQSTGGAASSVVSGDTNTLSVKQNATNPSEYIVTPITGSLSVSPENKGKVGDDAVGKEDNGKKLTTIQTTRDMINKAHWNLQIGTSSDPNNAGESEITSADKNPEPIHAGDTVNFFAGKNVKLKRHGSDITISAADTAVDKGEIIPATNTTNTNNNGTVMAKDGDGDKFANITNVVNAINSAFWKIGEENSGKPEVKGNVTAGSQVNFSNGVGTIAKVTADEANKTYKVQYDVNAGPGIEISTDENDPNKGKVKVKVDNSTVTINDDGQLVANSAWNANATGNVDGTSAAKAVKANATVNFDAGENLKVKQTGDEANQVYSFSLNQTLTNITSIQNKATGPKLTFGDNSINITGGNLDMGNNQITNLKPGTNGTDAVNLDQLNASRINVTSSDHSVTVNPKIDANTHQTTYDLSVNLSNVAKSSWNVKSSAADGGAVTDNHNAAEKNIVDSNTVEFKAGKNLTVEQVNGGNGANVTFALSNNITLDNNGSIKIGDTNITNGAVSNLTTHLVDPVKVDGDVENATKTADLAANLTTPTAADYRGKDAATVEDVLKAGWNLQANGKAVDAVTHGNNVNFASNDSSVEITPTTDGNTSTINLSVNATNVVKQVTGNVSANTTTGKAVVGKDGNEDTSANAGNKVATVGDVANTINNTGWITKTTDGANVTVNPGDRVEYVDGKGTKANVTVNSTTGQDIVNVTYDVKTDGTTVTVNNDGNLTVVTGNITKASDDVTNSDAGKVTVNTGDDNKVATVKNVVDAINSAGWIVNTGKAADQNSFTTVEGTATKVGAGDKVNFQAGKNLEVRRDGNNITYATSEDLDAKNITVTTVKVGKDGKDGVDGSIGVTGKDGAAVAINGKDGSIGLTGPKGADGKDGASVTIKPEKGTTTVAERDGGKEINRVTYTDKDKDGNDIKREIATLDDGLKFTGDDGQTVNRTLGSNLNVKGGATTSTTAKNIRVTKAADGQGLDVNLANNVTLNNDGSLNIGGTTVKDGDIKIGNTHITNGAVSNLTTHLVDPVKVDGDVENATKTADLAANLTTPTAADYRGKDAATVEDVLKAGWNLQANGKAVDAVTHGNNVNFASNDSSVEITPTTDGNTSTINLSVNATNVVKQVTGNVSANTTTGKAVVGKDGNEDTSANAGNKVATVGDVANTINNTGWITKTTDGANVTVNPGDRVEYVDGKGTKANVTVNSTTGQDIVNVTYDVKTDGTTVTVNNDGNLTVVTGNITKASDDVTNSDAGKVTVNTGDDNKVATVKNVVDAINSAGWIVNTGKAADQNSFTTVEGTATKVGAGDKVNFQAGKNLEVRRDGNNITYATSEDLDAKNITVTTVKVGKDGKDGVDGSIGVTGKDGAAVAINGKDGSIGLTGPKGADGKDGASVTIKPEKGTTTVAERDGGKEINRVTYTDKDKDGNDIKREIATLDDGLKFTGDDGQTVNRTLGSNLNVKGGATTSTTAKNIRVTKAADGQGLDVNLANNIELDNNGSIKIGDTTVNQDGITINNGPSVTKGGIDAGGKTITNVAPGKNGTDAVNVDQLRGSLTNIQGDIHKARKEGRAGIAGANAAAGLPQVYLPGKSMVAASAGTFKGQNALAVGYSRSSDNGKVIFKLQGNANTQGDVGGSVGIGYQW